MGLRSEQAGLSGMAVLLPILFVLANCLDACGADNTILTPGQQAGERRILVVNDVEFPFRWAPSGVFEMGSPEDEENRQSYELLHQVTLTKGFWILETEVSQKMWLTTGAANPSKWVGELLPVDTVSIQDCEQFCNELSKRASLPEGTCFRLPTEAQWEYAARSGKSGMESGPTGGKPLDEIAWYGDEDYNGTHPVGTKSPNDWGIYDMLGNLWEWCSDRSGDYQANDEGKGIAVTDPTGATEEETPANLRVDRGGCWDSHDYECRLAYRGYYDGDRKGPYVGFRIVYIPNQE